MAAKQSNFSLQSTVDGFIENNCLSLWDGGALEGIGNFDDL
jgi:hypothetical protein